MEKTKTKTIEQSGVRKGSPMEGVGSIWREEGFREKVYSVTAHFWWVGNVTLSIITTPTTNQCSFEKTYAMQQSKKRIRVITE